MQRSVVTALATLLLAVALFSAASASATTPKPNELPHKAEFSPCQARPTTCLTAAQRRSLFNQNRLELRVWPITASYHHNEYASDVSLGSIAIDMKTHDVFRFSTPGLGSGLINYGAGALRHISMKATIDYLIYWGHAATDASKQHLKFNCQFWVGTPAGGSFGPEQTKPLDGSGPSVTKGSVSFSYQGALQIAGSQDAGLECRNVQANPASYPLGYTFPMVVTAAQGAY